MNTNTKSSIEVGAFDIVVLMIYILFCMLPVSFDEKGISCSGVIIGSVGLIFVLRAMVIFKRV